MSIEIRQHSPGSNVKDFIRVPHLVFGNDPVWIPTLNMVVADQLNPAKNPLFQHAEVALFTAHKNGRLVGRISAQVDQEHLKRYQDSTGFFGFFDTIDDQEVARALVEAAGDFVSKRGMKVIRGPLSLSINEELGLLVDGFDTPPMVMMAHSTRYQGALAEAAGLTKVKDLYAWRFKVAELAPRAVRAWEQISALPEVEVKNVNRSDLGRDIRKVLEIYNDAWSENWGFVPATEAEGEKMAEDMKLVIDERLAFWVMIDGEPAAICIAFPNLNEAARDLDGKLFPFGIFKLLWRVRVKHPRTARVLLMGIKKKFRNRKRYGPLALFICAEIARRGKDLGYEGAEVSWTLEDNIPINLTIRAMGCERYKTYRIYEKPTAG
jgi:hypothetical protein